MATGIRAYLRIYLPSDDFATSVKPGLSYPVPIFARFLSDSAVYMAGFYFDLQPDVLFFSVLSSTSRKSLPSGAGGSGVYQLHKVESSRQVHEHCGLSGRKKWP